MAGISLRCVRSPEAPKMTSAHGGAGRCDADRADLAVHTRTDRNVKRHAGFQSPRARCARRSPCHPSVPRDRRTRCAARPACATKKRVGIARVEAAEQREGDHGGRYVLLDGRLDGPARPSPESSTQPSRILELGILLERIDRQIEQPERTTLPCCQILPTCSRSRLYSTSRGSEASRRPASCRTRRPLWTHLDKVAGAVRANQS